MWSVPLVFTYDKEVLLFQVFLVPFFSSAFLWAASIIFFFFSVPMANEQKKLVVIDVLPMMSKITKQKLIGLNYFNWCKIIQIYLRKYL